MSGDAAILNWGILGSAKVAEKVIVPGIQRSGNGRVYAVASRTAETARDFGARTGAGVSYDSYEALLDDEKVQAVYVPLPNSMHAEWTIRALEKGKHVLCEKPMAQTYADAVRMVEASRRNGVLLMEAFAHRFHPQNIAVKRMVDEGRIGEVTGFTAVHSSSPPTVAGDIRLSRELRGGVLADKGCYCVNTARLMMGEPTSVFAQASYFEEHGVDRRMTVELTFKGGRTAQLDTSFALKDDAYFQSYTVLGERARIWVPIGFAQRETYRQATIVPSSYYLVKGAGLGLETERFDVAGVHQWGLEVAYFAERVLQSRPIEFPSEDGLAQARVMDAIYRSAAEGRSIVL